MLTLAWPASRCPGRNPASSGSAANTSPMTPAGSGMIPQVMATSKSPAATARLSAGSNIGCIDTLT
jgi:hypothetical protein